MTRSAISLCMHRITLYRDLDTGQKGKMGYLAAVEPSQGELMEGGHGKASTDLTATAGLRQMTGRRNRFGKTWRYSVSRVVVRVYNQMVTCSLFCSIFKILLNIEIISSPFSSAYRNLPSP